MQTDLGAASLCPVGTQCVGVERTLPPLFSGGLPLTEFFVLEPGYYEDGAFGIRIENVVLVVPVKTKVSVLVFS